MVIVGLCHPEKICLVLHMPIAFPSHVLFVLPLTINGFWDASSFSLFLFLFFKSRTGDSIRGFVRPWVRPSLESKSGKTRISAPAHPPATGIGRVSGLV